jgi:hypothetical protein
MEMDTGVLVGLVIAFNVGVWFFGPKKEQPRRYARPDDLRPQRQPTSRAAAVSVLSAADGMQKDDAKAS